MLTEEEKSYFQKSVKSYRFLSKVSIVPMAIPVGALLYCYATFQDKSSNELMGMLIIGFVLLCGSVCRIHVVANQS